MPAEPAAASSALALAYLWMSAAVLGTLVALRVWGLRPLSIGADRVRWPLAPAPSLVLLAVLMVAGAATAAAVMQALGPDGAGGLRERAVASLANYGAQLLLMAGIWWALAETLRRRAVDGSALPAPPAEGDTRAARMPRWRASLVGAAAMAVAWPLAQAAGVLAGTVQSAIGGTEVPDTAHRTLEALGQSSDALWMGVTALVAVILAPIVEEILYRGALQQAMRGLGASRTLALWIASALFALAHWGSLVDGAEAGALAMLMVLGLAFGWCYERTGSLWAPVAAHALFNAANLTIALVQR